MRDDKITISSSKNDENTQNKDKNVLINAIKELNLKALATRKVVGEIFDANLALIQLFVEYEEIFNKCRSEGFDPVMKELHRAGLEIDVEARAGNFTSNLLSLSNNLKSLEQGLKSLPETNI